MTADTDDAAVVYVRAAFTKDELADFVADTLSATVERTDWGVTGVAGDGWDIALSSNPIPPAPDADPDESDFLTWPWQLAYTPHDSTPLEASVQTLTRLLNTLHLHGHWSVAACTYERSLPRHGGWHNGRYLGQPTFQGPTPPENHRKGTGAGL